jgi:hypothetical protein
MYRTKVWDITDAIATTDEGTLQRTWQAIEYRFDVLRASNVACCLLLVVTRQPQVKYFHGYARLSGTVACHVVIIHTTSPWNGKKNIYCFIGLGTNWK